MFSVTVFTALLGSGFQRRMFPFLWFPELSPTSACRLSFDFSLDSRLGLHSLGTHLTENIASNSSSIVACLRSCCLATVAFAKPFHSNGCLCWLHSYCFEQICHNTREKLDWTESEQGLIGGVLWRTLRFITSNIFRQLNNIIVNLWMCTAFRFCFRYYPSSTYTHIRILAELNLNSFCLPFLPPYVRMKQFDKL
jgi:hypothetical protein